MEEAENAIGENISCADLPTVDCDINNLNDREKLLRLWELAEQFVNCMNRCGRLAAEQVRALRKFFLING